MLTLAPLPDWKVLLKAFFSSKPDVATLLYPWVKQGETAGWFSRSAWSLVKIAKWRTEYINNKLCSIWVPDYFCNSSLAPLRAMGVELVFYPVTANMEPDYKACRQLSKEHKMDLFILAHYFGKPVIAAQAKEICLQNDAWLIEDSAHVLKRESDVGKYGDFILFSPHKLIAIPDGALLVVCPKGPGKLGKGLMAQFGDARCWSEELFPFDESGTISVRSSRRHMLTWVLKRALQKLGVRGKKTSTSFVEDLPDAITASSSLIPPVMSTYSLKLLAIQIDRIPYYARLRQRNLLHWKSTLAKLSTPHSLVIEPHNRDWTPYLSVFKLDNSNAEEQFNRLRSLPLPGMTWPDLPPEVLKDSNNHKVACRLRHSHVFFPLHHSIRDRDLYKVSQNFIQPFDSLQIKLTWNSITNVDWSEYLKRVGRSSLLQSWEYGEAKHNTENWHIKRGVFSIDGQEVAVVQVLVKRLLGLLKVYRINRGPLFLRKPDQATVHAVFYSLQKELTGFMNRRVLFHAPELDLDGNSIILLSRLGYRLINSRGWESIWVDLRQDQEKLRTQLDRKWRNKLVIAEKNGLSFTACTHSDSFEWILGQCSEMMTSRNAGKIPVELYRDLKKRLDETSKSPTVIKAFAGEDLVAGICVVHHGSAATYLLGWNGEVGRQLKANQFLLWHAMLYLKEQGVDWLDLGGIDEEGVPGITEFKLGVNGERYALVGEYMSMMT